MPEFNIDGFLLLLFIFMIYSIIIAAVSRYGALAPFKFIKNALSKRNRKNEIAKQNEQDDPKKD